MDPIGRRVRYLLKGFIWPEAPKPVLAYKLLPQLFITVALIEASALAVAPILYYLIRILWQRENAKIPTKKTK